MTDSTTIKLSRKSKNRLDNFREYRRESYEEILDKIFDILNSCAINPSAARIKLIKIRNRKNENLLKQEPQERNNHSNLNQDSKPK